MSQTEATTENGIVSKQSIIDGASAGAIEKAQRSSYEFAVAGDRHVNIKNCEYDEGKHTYSVRFEKGLPVFCSCPGFEHFEGNCKHMLGCLIRSPIMEAMKPLMTDGGSYEARQLPYTEHTEPAEQGGYRYHKCSDCERELLVSLGGFEKLGHSPDCQYRD